MHSLHRKSGDSIKSRTFCSVYNAFSLSKNEQRLEFHYNNFREKIEIINHDCIDFIFYHNKKENKIKVISFIEQNDWFNL